MAKMVNVMLCEFYCNLNKNSYSQIQGRALLKIVLESRDLYIQNME